MSAFIVQDQTISCILSWMQHSDHRPYFEQPLAELSIPFGCTEDEIALGQRMLALNTAAVNARYEEDEPTSEYQHRYLPVSSVQAYKALQCWLYQCSEGHVPNDPLFKLFEDDVLPYLAYDIIRRLPQYEEAKWD